MLDWVYQKWAIRVLYFFFYRYIGTVLFKLDRSGIPLFIFSQPLRDSNPRSYHTWPRRYHCTTTLCKTLDTANRCSIKVFTQHRKRLLIVMVRSDSNLGPIVWRKNAAMLVSSPLLAPLQEQPIWMFETSVELVCTGIILNFNFPIYLSVKFLKRFTVTRIWTENLWTSPPCWSHSSSWVNSNFLFNFS